MKSILIPVSSLLLATASAPALQLRLFSPTAHQRLTNFPASPQINPTFLNSSGNPSTLLNLTGVGWSNQDSTKQLTLVSPRHIVGANHHKPALNSQVVFLAPDNTLHSYTITSLTTLPNADSSPSDLFLGELAQSIPATTGIQPLPYLNLLNEAAYAGQPLIVLGKSALGGRGIISSVLDFGGDPITAGTGVQTRAFNFTYQAAAGSVDDAYCEVGDSGSPSFVVASSGKPALVGTHTAIASGAGSTITFDTLVPHYVPALNPLMETTGYHMIKATPPATSFTASGQALTTPIRSAKPFEFSITLTNGSALAENVSLSVSPAPSSISGAGWIPGESGTVRRGGMPASSASTLTLSFAGLPATGPATLSLTVVSDGSGSQSFDFPITLLPSFHAWAAGLADPSTNGDSDHDSIPNLLEYAFGGDNQTASHTLPADPSQALLPHLSDPSTLTFLRRTDRADRALTYIVESSHTLAPGSWTPIESPAPTVLSQPAPGIEKVSQSLPAPTTDPQFFRLRVELAE